MDLGRGCPPKINPNARKALRKRILIVKPNAKLQSHNNADSPQGLPNSHLELPLTPRYQQHTWAAVR